MGATAGGLPYPVASDMSSGGAAAIQALADALQARGGAQVVQRGRVNLAFNGGRATIPLTLTTLIGAVLTGEWGSGGPSVPLVLSLETGVSTPTSLAVAAYRPSTPATTDAAWYTGNAWINYQAWGT